MWKVKVNKTLECQYDPPRTDMFPDNKIRHIYFHKDFKLEELKQYGFVRAKNSGYYELWIAGKLALVVPTGRRVKGGKHHLMLECCTAKPSIKMLFIIIKMANDGMFELFEETRESLKRKQIEKLKKEIETLQGEE